MYEGHIYPFWNQVTDFEYEDMVPIMIFLQTYVQESNRTNPTPFWMGEFGTNVDSEEWRKIIRFLQSTIKKRYYLKKKLSILAHN